MFDETFKKIYDTLNTINEVGNLFDAKIFYEFKYDKIIITFEWSGNNTFYRKKINVVIDKKKIGWQKLETDIKKITGYIKKTYEKKNLHKESIYTISFFEFNFKK